MTDLMNMRTAVIALTIALVLMGIYVLQLRDRIDELEFCHTGELEHSYCIGRWDRGR